MCRWASLKEDSICNVTTIISKWGWKIEYDIYDMDKLPQKPGICVMYKKDKIINLETTANLYQCLNKHPMKYRMTSFDWCRTKTIGKAGELEKELNKKIIAWGREDI